MTVIRQENMMNGIITIGPLHLKRRNFLLYFDLFGCFLETLGNLLMIMLIRPIDCQSVFRKNA